VLKRMEILWDPMPISHVLVFYLGIPVIMSIMFGINHAGLAKHFTIPDGTLYWAGIWVPFWLMLDLSTRASAVALRPWSPPLWLLLILGSALAMLASRPYIVWYIAYYQGQLPTVELAPPVALAQAWRQLDRLLGFMGTPLFWMAINYYYDRVLSIPRYRGRSLAIRGESTLVQGLAPAAQRLDDKNFTNAVQATSPVKESKADLPTVFSPPFMALLPPRLGNDLVALQAEDHYVRIHTTLGNGLVRYRFSDALLELTTVDGLRVHRSFWVCKRHITKIERVERGWSLMMYGDVVVPVSHAYREAVRLVALSSA
jgi:hypothetical protein